MKKYPGQAIAIIMVVLVVAAVIGASLYSRMIRNKGEVVDTRESQKALEQAGNVLDAFTTSDLPSLQNLLSEKLSEDDDGKIVLDDIGSIRFFLEELSGDQMDLGLLGLGEEGSSCSEPVVTITYAQASDGIEYGVGDVMAINVDGVEIPAGCVATLTFDTAGSGDHLFTTKYVYTEDDGDVIPYALDDMELYCLNSSGSDNCGDGSVAPTSSIKQKLGKGGSITLNFPDNLYEFRILPLKEKIKIGLQGNEACGHILDNYSIKSTVTCTGQERTMQVVIPNAMNMGYPSLFDYTIYNSQGTLTPYHPEL
jgi:hypothetical protein